MNHGTTLPSVGEFTSVSFVPLNRTREPSPARPVSQCGSFVANQIIDELHQPLAELARRIQRVGAVSGGTVVLLTGSSRGVGCTTVALALSLVSAAERRTLLVDADLHEPRLASMFGLRPQLSWEQVVGVGSLNQALQELQSPGLSILAVKAPARPTALSRSCAIECLTRLRQEFSLIVLDGGAVWDSGTQWSPLVDVALVVCDSGRKVGDEWAGAWDRLEEAGTQVLGIVETFA